MQEQLLTVFLSSMIESRNFHSRVAQKKLEDAKVKKEYS